MKLQHSVPALTLTLALASLPVLAQGHHGGGSRGGHGGGGSRGGYSGGGSHGGYSGGGSHGGYGGSAVARQPGSGAGGMHYGSRPGYAPRGSVAEQRHPRAGTGYGYGGYGYGGHGYGYNQGHGYYHGGHSYYRPYYGYGGYYPYYPYYSSYWPGVSLSFGWGYGSSWPYYAGGYYDSPGYTVGAYAPYVASGGDDSGAAPPPAREAERSYEGPSGRVRLEVRPDDASVYVDDQFRGTARDARIMNLPPGRHVIELVRPGFAIERREVTVVTGESQDLLVELLRP
jgi:hypothetical protein